MKYIHKLTLLCYDIIVIVITINLYNCDMLIVSVYVNIHYYEYKCVYIIYYNIL